VLLVIGAVDLGRAGYVGIEVENAAHAGAEYGSLNPSDTATITDGGPASRSECVDPDCDDANMGL
jgi:hypothetical protein